MLKWNFKKVVLCAVAYGVSLAWAGPDDDFFRAVVNDNTSTMSTLFLRGTDPNVRNDKGQVALFLALQQESLKAAASLLAHPDIKVDLENGVGETPLMMAGLKGHVDLMRQLIERGARVQKDGWSPIHYAATGPDSRAVELLLDRGAAINARSPNGSTPLMMAARYGSEASVKLLVRRGADLRARNDLDLAAADFARQGGRDALADELARVAALR